MKQNNVTTFDPKALHWEELPEQQIHVLVGNPQTPSPGGGAAGLQTMGCSYWYPLRNFGPIGCSRDFSSHNCPGMVVDNRGGHARSNSDFPGLGHLRSVMGVIGHRGQTEPVVLG